MPAGNAAPVFVADAGTGVGLGALYFAGNGGANNSAALGFTSDRNIRTVFAVFKGSSFLLTAADAYHFHRPSNGNPADPLWEAGNGWSSLNIRNGSTYVNGALVNGASYAMPTSLRNGFNLVEVLTTGPVTADSFNKDRVYHAGNQYHAEVIIYDRLLSESERLQVESYLSAKWFNTTLYTITATAGAGGTISPSGAVTVNSGASQTFSITANAGYQIADVTADGVSKGAVATYTFPNVTANHSIAATFSVIAVPPSITSQPVSQTENAGQSVTFNVSASGTAPLSYQWQKGGVNIAGATAASYTIASVSATDAGSYRCVVMNVAGSATSAAATLTVNTVPLILTQPQSATVESGASVVFSVSAAGAGPLNYQWQKGGVNIAGATNASYTIVFAATTSAGSYQCVVSNMVGPTLSASATLTVTTSKLAAPTTVTASDGTYSDKVVVSWSAVPSATSYDIWRGASSLTLSATKIGTSSATSYTDTSATPGVTYYYRVKAVRNSTVSGFSPSDTGFRSGSVMGDPTQQSGSAVTTNLLAGDFDGDGKADPVRVTSDGVWRVRLSASGNALVQATFSDMTGTPVVGDIDGDRKADIATVTSAGIWSIRLSSTGYAKLGSYSLGWGGAPVLADVDGDGLADPAVCTPDGWYFTLSRSYYQTFGPITFMTFGTAINAALAADIDGDRLADPIEVYADGWYLFLSTQGYAPTGPCLPTGGTAVVGDFDGDLLADPVYVLPDGSWYVWLSTIGYQCVGPALLFP